MVKQAAAPAPVWAPPNGPMEIAFSFDTTGSMSSYLANVREQLQEIVTRLFADIPTLRISIMAHGDYCDKNNYVTKHVDLTNDVTKLTDFVNKVKTTGGGDWEECYELVLRQMRTHVTWSAGTQRALVMVGDAIPHGTSYPENKLKIDWKKEVVALREMGVRIYAVQCGANPQADAFWKHLSDETGGTRLQLSEFRSIVDLMMAVCYREADPDMLRAFEKEVRLRDGPNLHPDLGGIFGSLRTDDALDTEDAASPVEPAPVVLSRGAGSKFSPKRKSRVTRPAATPMKTPKRRAPKRLSPRSVVTTPRRRRSTDSESSTSSRGSRRSSTGVVTRANRHSMSLRATPQRRTPTTIAKAKPKRLAKTTPLSRLLREQVRSADHVLSDLDWSEWKLGLATGQPRARGWQPRCGDRLGFRNTSPFPRSSLAEPAVYEVAVQPTAGAARVPVTCSVTEGFHGCSWDRFVLRDECAQSQADRVLKRGCKIYVRRAPLSAPAKSAVSVTDSVRELRSLIGRKYDYAWKRRYDATSRRYLYRSLCRNDVIISDNVRQ